jgi:hypothetical protein
VLPSSCGHVYFLVKPCSRAEHRSVFLHLFVLSWYQYSYLDVIESSCYLSLHPYLSELIRLYYLIMHIGKTGEWPKLCVAAEGCAPPVEHQGNLLCMAYCVSRGYDKDKSACLPDNSSTCCCAKWEMHAIKIIYAMYHARNIVCGCDWIICLCEPRFSSYKRANKIYLLFNSAYVFSPF